LPVYGLYYNKYALFWGEFFRDAYGKSKTEEKEMRAPNMCPMCGEQAKWIKVDKTKKGYSIGKAAIGGLLLGPIGLLGGALGKKKVTYACASCGFEHEYDNEAFKDR